MNALAKVVKYELSDVIRSKWILAYAFFFLLATDALFRFGGSSAKVLLSLMNVVLILIPLVSVVFGTMYLYNAREFTELLLSQPVNRKTLFGGLYAGLVVPLSASFVAGVGLPFLWHHVEAGAHYQTLAVLLLTGVLLTSVFIALAFLVAVRYEEKVKGLGVALLLWLLFTVLYDGFVLLVAHAFSAYPLEGPIIALTLFNPVDLGRVLLLLHFDIAALMGYTGAVFERFFGSVLGLVTALGALGLWGLLPFLLGLRQFRRKDF